MALPLACLQRMPCACHAGGQVLERLQRPVVGDHILQARPELAPGQYLHLRVAQVAVKDMLGTDLLVPLVALLLRELLAMLEDVRTPVSLVGGARPLLRGEQSPLGLQLARPRFGLVPVRVCLYFHLLPPFLLDALTIDCAARFVQHALPDREDLLRIGLRPPVLRLLALLLDQHSLSRDLGMLRGLSFQQLGLDLLLVLIEPKPLPLALAAFGDGGLPLAVLPLEVVLQHVAGLGLPLRGAEREDLPLQGGVPLELGMPVEVGQVLLPVPSCHNGLASPREPFPGAQHARLTGGLGGNRREVHGRSAGDVHVERWGARQNPAGRTDLTLEALLGSSVCLLVSFDQRPGGLLLAPPDGHRGGNVRVPRGRRRRQRPLKSKARARAAAAARGGLEEFAGIDLAHRIGKVVEVRAAAPLELAAHALEGVGACPCGSHREGRNSYRHRCV
mmetsp:Transcript_99822/g.280665  ORF Transcript_99822/g.280665 Transcript_99822/m.280665 type:complete len:447 (+) Transcript_99822:584-1924(+)